MSIFTGSVGSGKSYHALREGIRQISVVPDRFVVANFPIKYSKREKKRLKEQKRWIFLEDKEITPDNLIRLSFELGIFGHEGYCLLIIDEAGIFFNARDWQVKGQERADWIKFFSQSRKFGYDIILVAQDLRMIDRQIRSIADFEVMHKALKKYFWLKWLPFKTFAYIEHWMNTRFRGRVTFDILLPWVAKKYDTMRLFKITDELRQIASRMGYDI
jgi:zona occludens toxin (predicted ATPase)